MIETLFIANTAEAFEDLLRRTMDTEEGKRRMWHEFALSQRAFFWGGDEKVIITPYPIPEALVRHNSAVCGFSNVVHLAPAEAAIELSKVIISDDALIGAIIEYARGNPEMKISPYAVTDGFLSLLANVREMGLSTMVDWDFLEHSFWTVRYLDSKIGFRTEMQKLMPRHQEIRIPEGFIAEGRRDAIHIVQWLHANGRSAVVKANHGESGWGLLLLKKEEFPSPVLLREALEGEFGSDSIWEDTLIVVEEFIEPDYGIAGGSPSTELFVNGEGSVITYHCGQILDEHSGFLGVEMGRGVITGSLRNTLEHIAAIIGKRYHALGYRGFFDIDYVVAQDGMVYVVETNQRRTGGTHVYDFAKHAFSDAWEHDAYFLSHDSIRYGSRTLPAESLLERMRAILYPIEQERRGIIVTFVNPLEPVIGCIVVGNDVRDGLRLHQELFQLLSDS